VVPTVLDALGLPADDDLPGFALTRPVPAGRVQLCERDTWRSIVQWPRKLVVAGDVASLIDLERDPLELSPTLLDDAARAARQQEFVELLRAQERGRPRRFPKPQQLGDMGAEELSALQALGYLDAGEH